MWRILPQKTHKNRRHVPNGAFSHNEQLGSLDAFSNAYSDV